MVVLPTLIFMLTLSAAIHLTNYYVDSGGSQEAGAGVKALTVGARPVILATLTTVFGFGSLAVSQLGPVWQFGCLAALGLLLSTALLLSAFPAAVNLGARLAPTNAKRESRMGRALVAALGAFTSRWSTAIMIIGSGLLIWSACGLLHLKTSTEFEHMFPEDSRAMGNLHWVQNKLGPLNSLEFLVTFPDTGHIELLERVAAIDDVSRNMRAMDQVLKI